MASAAIGHAPHNCELPLAVNDIDITLVPADRDQDVIINLSAVNPRRAKSAYGGRFTRAGLPSSGNNSRVRSATPSSRCQSREEERRQRAEEEKEDEPEMAPEVAPAASPEPVYHPGEQHPPRPLSRSVSAQSFLDNNYRSGRHWAYSIMPSRAPTYYHWSQDKPCTTNQTYGFDVRHHINPLPDPNRKMGPFDYSRPFSNCGFFPEITHSGGLVAKHSSRGNRSKSAGVTTVSASVPEKPAKFDINEGYTVGNDSISRRVVKSAYPADVRLVRFQSAPPPHKYGVPREKDLFLWHTLSGCLVHCKNSPPEIATSS